ncbi:MAG: hypothetical protein WDA15_07795 [Trueperaceae bacterium]
MTNTAVEHTVNERLRSAQVTFCSAYRDRSYSYISFSSTLTGAKLAVTVTYSGSVTEILTGAQHSATGTASATYSWNGCRWVGTGVEY